MILVDVYSWNFGGTFRFSVPFAQSLFQIINSARNIFKYVLSFSSAMNVFLILLSFPHIE